MGIFLTELKESLFGREKPEIEMLSIFQEAFSTHVPQPD